MVMKSREYTTVRKVSGPLIIVEGISDVAYGEVVEIKLPSGERRRGQVLEARTDIAIVQVFEGTRDIDTDITSVLFTGETMKIAVSEKLSRMNVIPEDEFDKAYVEIEKELTTQFENIKGA